MKKIMLVGKSGCGKTTLSQRLMDMPVEYKKTQAIEVVGSDIMDTPGEYMERKEFYKALIVSSVDADVILMLQSCVDEQFTFSPRMGSMFNRPMIGVVTKIDLAESPSQISTAEELLQLVGVEKTFQVGFGCEDGVSSLRDFLCKEEMEN